MREEGSGVALAGESGQVKTGRRQLSRLNPDRLPHLHVAMRQHKQRKEETAQATLVWAHRPRIPPRLERGRHTP
jgi:hypothetical protein